MNEQEKQYINMLERVSRISAQIFKVTKLSSLRAHQESCPHGNIPAYPTHAWWCDGCFRELESALEELESNPIPETIYRERVKARLITRWDMWENTAREYAYETEFDEIDNNPEAMADEIAIEAGRE